MSPNVPSGYSKIRASTVGGDDEGRRIQDPGGGETFPVSSRNTAILALRSVPWPPGDVRPHDSEGPGAFLMGRFALISRKAESLKCTKPLTMGVKTEG